MRNALAITIILFFTQAAAAIAGEPPSREILAAWEKGKRGIIDIYKVQNLQAGQEFPVVRDDAITGIFTIYYVGKLNAWGTFSSHSPEAKLHAGDKVILIPPSPAAKKKQKRSIVISHILYAIPTGFTTFCFITGGEAEGIHTGGMADVFNKKVPAGTFNVMFAGEHRSYGMLNTTGAGSLSDLTLHFHK